MDSVALYIGIAVAIVLVAVVVLVALVRGKSKASPPPVTGAPSEADSTTIEAPPSRGLDPDVSDAVADDTAIAVLDRPEAPAGRLTRLRSRLARSNKLGQGLLALLSRGDLTEDTWDEIEETLLTSDLGVGPTTELMEQLRTEIKIQGNSDPAKVREFLRQDLLGLVDPTLDRSLATQRNAQLEVPAVVMVVGVNGTGKTTTTGKLARLLVAEDEDVVLGAADTFRAAAAVAFEAVSAGIEGDSDCVLIDTAGRLHTKVGLMDELGKVKRVIEKKAPVTEVLLVLDATTGQNGLVQARVFADVVNITGVVLTKLDGTAKGGIVVAVQRELGVPVKLVGLGEGPDDLAPFDPETFVDALLG